jgi:hypothetical protein
MASLPYIRKTVLHNTTHPISEIDQFRRIGNVRQGKHRDDRLPDDLVDAIVMVGEAYEQNPELNRRLAQHSGPKKFSHQAFKQAIEHG